VSVEEISKVNLPSKQVRNSSLNLMVEEPLPKMKNQIKEKWLHRILKVG
jgi:hypothetical protein